jgi:F-type H+-transporting ATPase subunit b
MMAFAAEAGHGPSVSGLLWRILVFVVFAILLYRLLNKKIKDGTTAGVELVKKSIEDAVKANQDAKNELEEYSRKIAGMHDELERMKANARKTAENESNNILNEAEKTAVRLKDVADKMIAAERDKAIADLGREQFFKAIQGAEQRIAQDKDANKKKKYIADNIMKIGA